MIHVDPATAGDLRELCANLRPADHAELLASLGHACPDRMWQHVRGTDVFAARDAAGALVAVFGITQHALQSEVGVPWLLGTPNLFRHPKALHKLALAHLARWQQQYPILTNATDRRNTQVLRWLQRLGFHFTGTMPAPVDASVTFIQFVRSYHV